MHTQYRRNMMRVMGCTLAFVMTGSAPSATAQQPPIRIVVGALPGGSTDTLAREIGKHMAALLNRTVIVDNRPGAGGNIAADSVARSAPDGNTLLMAYTSHTINASLFKQLPYDPVKDFTPITMVATTPSLLVVAQHVPVNTLSELLTFARKNPGKLNIALGGVGTSIHLAGEKFKAMTGVNFVNVPYKSTSPAMADLLAGHVDVMFANPITVLPQISAGKIKVLGVSSAVPLKQLPNVPPIGNTIPGFSSEAWFGLFAPANLPHDVTQTLYQAAKQAIQDPAFVRRIEADGGTTPSSGMSPAQFAAFVAEDVARWAEVIQATGAIAD